ncbi:MAG: transposase [Isosphaeraceae bacterium]|nr:transposase [Isosphaeraceae bacterium]
MPRTARASAGNYCYHVLNRGNGRATVFHDDADYESFIELIGEASDRLPMRVLAFCLMPDHFHLVVRPNDDGDLSRWMQWVLTAHVRRYHRRYQTSGHVWQGRFKAFPIEPGEPLRTVLRYVERNPVRSRLTKRAERWPWSSLKWWADPRPLPYLDVRSVRRGEDWVDAVNRPMPEADEERIKNAMARGAPFGSERWVRRTADDLGLGSSLNPRGRPRKVVE